MLLWEPDAVLPSIDTFTSSPSSSASASSKQHHDVEEEKITRTVNNKKRKNKQLNPHREVARMKVLKKLRHKLVVLTSSSTSNNSDSKNKKQLPVLCFERWLSRYALRREIKKTGTTNNDLNDPLVPSDGFVDMGLVKDLSRSSILISSAKDIVRSLAVEAQNCVMTFQQDIPDDNDDDEAGGAANRKRKKQEKVNAGRQEAKKSIKHGLKDVKAKAKAVQKALIQATNDTISKSDRDIYGDSDEEDDGAMKSNVALSAVLGKLRSSTADLEKHVQTAQTHAIFPSLTDTAITSSGGISINGARRNGIFDIALKGPDGKPNRPYLTISKQHLSKLIHLWVLQHNDSSDKQLARFEEKDEADPTKYIESMPGEYQSTLRQAVFSCLSRYEALRGAGYQCAVPGVAFDAAAKSGLGPTIECFASPLNCRYRHYCSAFPDVESRFGSIGSFFDNDAFNPNEGSFEANPPFVPEIMDAMGEKIERLLDEDLKGPLSFLCVVPNWGAGSGFCRKLEKSKHVRANILIPAADHAFFDGAQHTKLIPNKGNDDGASSLLRPSSWDTAVILLQNDKGALKWTVAEEQLKESFCAAFTSASNSIPEGSKTIKEWESRGISRGGSRKQKGLAQKTTDPPAKRRKSNNHIVF